MTETGQNNSLQTEKAYLDQLFESAQEAIVMGDNEGRILRINDEFTALFGYTSDEANGRLIDDLIACESFKEEASSITKRVAQGEKIKFDSLRCHKDGATIYVSVLASPIIIGNKQAGVYGIYRDITERKQAEEKLNRFLDILTKAKQEWEMTFDNVMELIMIIDRDLKIIRCNKSFAEFAGIPITELKGKKCYEFFSCDYKQIGHCRVRTQTGEIARKNEIKTESGRWFYESNYPILDEKGRFHYTVVVATDITDLKNTQEQLMEYQKELKNRIKELEEFYDMSVGRELRMIELKEEIEDLKEELSKYKREERRQ